MQTPISKSQLVIHLKLSSPTSQTTAIGNKSFCFPKFSQASLYTKNMKYQMNTEF